MGGGASLLAALVEWLPKVRPTWHWLVFLLPPARRAFEDPPPQANLRIEYAASGDSAPGRLWWLYRELPRRLESARADAVFAFANIASTRCPIPQVVYVHQLLAFQNSQRRLRLSVRARLRVLRGLILRGAARSAAVIVQTRDMSSRLQASVPELCGRLHVVPGCVSAPPAGSGIRSEKQRLIDECPWPRLAYVAHALAHKNHATLAKALPAIVQRYPGARLCLTIGPHGGNEFQDNTVAPDIQNLVSGLKMENHVVWLGHLNSQEVKYLFQQATVTVFPSLDESFGLPLAEAIVEGCPLAAADLPYAREVAGPAAVYFDPLNPSSIAATVCELISSDELRSRLRREAEARKGLFDPQTVAEWIAQIIEQAASDIGANEGLSVGPRESADSACARRKT
jgi:glycosyltransferase involved in cell wall biosynthesis